MGRTIYTIAYPQLAPADRAWIDRFRAEHDAEKCRMIRPHMTLVFEQAMIAEADYLAHVRAVGASMPRISGVIRHAMAWPESEGCLIFLVPDDGLGALARLHSRLYQGPLAMARRRDLPFIPHITVGALGDPVQAFNLCDGLNSGGLNIPFAVDSLAVVSVDGWAVTQLASCALLA